MRSIKLFGWWFLICMFFFSGVYTAHAESGSPVVQIIDNTDTGQTEVIGDWQASTWTGGGQFYETNYFHDKNTGKGSKKVRFTPNLTVGDYNVYLRHTSGSKRADNVPVDIHHAQGLATMSINQKQNGGPGLKSVPISSSAMDRNTSRLKTTAQTATSSPMRSLLLKSPTGLPVWRVWYLIGILITRGSLLPTRPAAIRAGSKALTKPPV